MLQKGFSLLCYAWPVKWNYETTSREIGLIIFHAHFSQFWKKWTICLDYSEFLSWIELRLVTSTADTILRLNTSYGCLESWRVDTSYGWLEFRRLDTGCGRLRTMADLSSSSWIRVTADCILRLTWVPAAGYDLRLIPSSGWLRVATDSILCGWLESACWTWLAADLYFNISSNFKDLFWKICHFYGLFSTEWFQLPLIQALAATSRTLKKLEEAWRSLKKLQDSSCDWF